MVGHATAAAATGPRPAQPQYDLASSADRPLAVNPLYRHSQSGGAAADYDLPKGSSATATATQQPTYQLPQDQVASTSSQLTYQLLQDQIQQQQVTPSQAPMPQPANHPTVIPSSAVTAQSAQGILARALSQSSPAMVKAISQPQTQQPTQQGLTVFKTEENASVQQQAPIVQGPATAALDEALRAQSEHRSKARTSNLLLTEAAAAPNPHKESTSSNIAVEGSAAAVKTEQVDNGCNNGGEWNLRRVNRL